MKTLVLALSAVAAVALLGACDTHPFEQTKVLHEKYQEHGEHGAAEHGDKAEHGAPEGHAEAKPAH